MEVDVTMPVDFGKQVGPLPLGAWVAVIVGGLGIAWYSRRQGEPVEVVEPNGEPGVGTGEVGGWIPTEPTAPAPPSNAPITTNEQWAVQAINWLLAQGYPATSADSAIRKYITGSRLSIAENALVGIALQRFGSPPQPLPPTESDPPPTTPPVIIPPTRPRPPTTTKPSVRPVPSKPRIRKYTVQPRDNLWNIAKHFYGNGFAYMKIYNANRRGKTRVDGTRGMISNPNLIHPGWELIIP